MAQAYILYITAHYRWLSKVSKDLGQCQQKSTAKPRRPQHVDWRSGLAFLINRAQRKRAKVNANNGRWNECESEGSQSCMCRSVTKVLSYRKWRRVATSPAFIAPQSIIRQTVAVERGKFKLLLTAEGRSIRCRCGCECANGMQRGRDIDNYWSRSN